MNKTLPAKEDFEGWSLFFYHYRYDLVWEALGLQDWDFPSEHRNALQGLFLQYILSRLDPERHLNSDIIHMIGNDVGKAMKAGFDPKLNNRHNAEYFKQLSLIVGYFSEHGPRPTRFPRTPKIRKIECCEIMLMFILRNRWPSNKQLVEQSKYCGHKYSAKDFSELMDDIGCTNFLSSSR